MRFQVAVFSTYDGLTGRQHKLREICVQFIIMRCEE